MKHRTGSRRLRTARALVAALAFSPLLLTARDRPRVGNQVPDFAFTDFAGRQHHLSEFSGHYLLLDFWATWCRPCVHEIPVMKKAYAKYHSRGLEIIGMDSDKKIKKAQQFVKQNQIPWVQSSPESTKNVLRHALKVRWYPTVILLNPQRKILLVSGNGNKILEGENLLKALDQFLPEDSASADHAENGSQ